MREPVVVARREAARKDARRAWIYLVLAYLLGALIVFGWVQRFAHPAGTEEDASLANTGLGLLTLIAGLPALLLLGKALARSQRARRSIGKTTQDWAMILPAALFIAAALGGGIVAGNKLQAETRRVQDQAGVATMDRSGVVVIIHRNHQYRNLNDRCSPESGPPPTVQCGPENRPSCRSRAWLVTHHAWPLTQVGTVPVFRPGVGGPGTASVGRPGVSQAILRPSDQEVPSILLIANRGCYLEYQRAP